MASPSRSGKRRERLSDRLFLFIYVSKDLHFLNTHTHTHTHTLTVYSHHHYPLHDIDLKSGPTDVLVVDNMIAKIGTSLQPPLDRKSAVVDVSGKTLMPGLIDMHSHLSIQEGMLEGRDDFDQMGTYVLLMSCCCSHRTSCIITLRLCVPQTFWTCKHSFNVALLFFVFFFKPWEPCVLQIVKITSTRDLPPVEMRAAMSWALPRRSK